MSKIPVIAIFDIGKTNKKVFLFDEQYNILHERSENLVETTDSDGDPCEDLELLTGWIKKSLHEISLIEEMDIKAVNFSAYGASFVHIDREGLPVTPLYNYLKPYPEPLKKQFYEKYGPELAFSMNTASPMLGNLNSGLQLYRIKNRHPELFDKIHSSLHLPQYLSFLVTGRRCSDITSIGCHTAMWNFPQNHYHEWLYREGIIDKLAPIFPSDQSIHTEYRKKALLCGVGLHDSSAALIPYLSNFTDPFVLISTGTWCISLNPFNQSPLTDKELKQDCLCYLEYRGNPIKASRLFAGYEHDQQVKRLADHFLCSADTYKNVYFDPLVINNLSDASPLFSKDSSDRSLLQESAFKKRDLSFFKTYEEAYHQLILDIMNQQVISTGLVFNDSKVKTIFVDGGFSNHSIYTNLLASAFPGVEVYAASISQASALGAALAIHHYWNKKPVPSNLIGLKQHSPVL
ncbi:MAG: FGGY-family carbohydrate kinase [Flavitalea sp.]